MIFGSVDAIISNHVLGWAFNSDEPDEHLSIVVNRGQQVLATTSANTLRTDLTFGKGDHGFSIDLPTSANVIGLTFTAHSKGHGSAILPTPTERAGQNSLKQLERGLDKLLGEFEELKNHVQHLETGGDNDLGDRVGALESRLEASEVFFLRLDEMMRKLVESEKKKRKRWLGIF